MKTISEIRRENLAILIKEAGNQSALADKVGCTSAQINQLINQGKDSKTNKPRNIGDSFARKLETATDKATGWMDNIHYNVSRSDELNAAILAMEKMTPFQVHQTSAIIAAITGTDTSQA